MGTDHVVHGRDALCVRQEEVLAVGELSRQPIERDERAGSGAGLDLPAVGRAVASALIDGQALVQPARGRVIRVPRRRVEHKVHELVRDAHGHERIVDLARRDEAEQRPDGGIGCPGDIFVGARPEGGVERIDVGVDEEVHRRLLGDAEQLRRVANLVLTKAERLRAEGGVALVPMDADEVAGHRLPIEPVVRVDDRSFWPERNVRRVVRGDEAPARDDRRIRDHGGVAGREERVGQRGGPGRRWVRHVDDGRSDGVRDGQQQLDSPDRLRDRDRLTEDDASPERRPGDRCPERHRIGGGHRRHETEQQPGCRRDRQDPADQSAHARPAIRTIPRPF